MKRLATISGIMVMAAVALATGAYFKVFNETYKVDANSDLGKASCSTCHTSKKGGKLNAYGKDIAAAMTAAKTNKLTPDILKKVEKLDSDKDGKSNIDEIKAGALPGAQ